MACYRLVPSGASPTHLAAFMLRLPMYWGQGRLAFASFAVLCSGGPPLATASASIWSLTLHIWVLQEQAKTLRRVGRGGLNEATGPSEEAGAAPAAEAGTSSENTGHRSAVVAGTEIIRQPSEAEQVLRLLTAQLRSLRNLPASSGELQHCRIWMYHQSTSKALQSTEILQLTAGVHQSHACCLQCTCRLCCALILPFGALSLRYLPELQHFSGLRCN